MRARRGQRPKLEGLEWRLAPSATALGGSTTAVVDVQHHRHPRPRHEVLNLNGQINGTYSSASPIPDVGTTQTLQGMGSVSSLGTVSLSGTLGTPGFIARGFTEGAVTLTNAHGSVKLQLTGSAPQPGFSPPAPAYHFTITGGTGAYAHASGKGTATLVETPERRPTPQPGQPTPEYIIAPMFTLTLHSATATG